MKSLSKPIDITMVAVLRPDVIRETLTTIRDNIVKDEKERYRLIINIDPIGEKVKPMKIVKLASQFFDNIKYNIAKTPSFTKAVKWVWQQVEADYVFHIEDDWLILRKINVDNMINILDKYPKLSSLRLYKSHTPNQKRIRTFLCIWNYNKDGFYLAEKWQKQFGLNPILIKKAFIDEALPRMVDTINPEKQFRYSQKFMRPVIEKWQYGLYTNPGDKALVYGKRGGIWREAQKMKKPVGQTFLTWVPK